MPPKGTRRKEQAAQTKREILGAARKLFAARGYAATSLSAIAEEAGVSIQTIYDSVGSKSELVAALNDLIDEEGDVGALAGRIPTEKNPRELIDIAVWITRNINDRCADIMRALYGGANIEPALAAIRDESRRRHRHGIKWLTGYLDEMGGLRDGLTIDEAADVIAGLTDPQVVRLFVFEYGWDWDRWHAWTLDSICLLVMPPGLLRRSKAGKRGK